MAAPLRPLRYLATATLAIGLLGPFAAGTRGISPAHAGSALASDGILRISDEGESDLRSIDPPTPQAGDAQSNLVEGLLFGGLVRLDEHLRVQPNAASSWTISNDGKVYTFTLRPGLKWGDGTPVTASDVVWSLSRAFSPAYASGATSYYLGHIVGGMDVTNGKAKTVRGLKAIGTDSVQITLDQPEAVILNQLAYSVADLVPPRQVQAGGKNWTDHVAALGPFIIKQWKHNQEIDLAPNPYYWRGVPRLKGVIAEFIQNTETAYNLYKTGGVDVMGSINFPGNHLKDVQGTPDLHATNQLFTEYLPVNEHRKPLDNVLVRRALSYAVNRAAITHLLNDRFLPASGILPPGMPGFNTHLVGQTFDPARARALLAQAGYPGGKGFPKLTLNVDGGDNDGQTKAIALKEFWHQVLGIDVSLNQLEHGAYNDALTARKFDIAFIQWGADYPDPQDFLSLLFQTQSPNNNGYYASKQFDQITSAADVMPHDSPARYAAYRRAEQVAVNDVAAMVLDWGRQNVLIRPSVHGLLLNAQGLTAPNWADVTVQ